MTNPNYDEQISFANGGDTGEDLKTSTQPIAPGEFVWDGVMNRPIENLRKRTEILRREAQLQRYYADYDRSLILRSDSIWNLAFDGGSGQYTLSGTDDLWIYPAATPGRVSGGRWSGGRVFVDHAGTFLPYAGTLMVNDLTLTANANYSGQRGYADGDDFDAGGPGATALTLGANGIKVSLVPNAALAGGVGTITAVISGNPKREITITYGTLTPTVLADVITFINADHTSMTTYGVADFLRASTTSGGGLAPPALTNGIVLGAYDSEAHQVTLAQITAFFAIAANRLLEGESLLIAYPSGPVEIGAGALGGRRQSIWDLPIDRAGTRQSNTTPNVGFNLFNSAREPEKIPGSVPVGKLINGQFVFIDGTRITPGTLGIQLGESSINMARLALHNPAATEGADFIGYQTTQLWNSDSGDGLSATTVRAALDEIVADIADQATPGGASRVGSEAIAGASNAPNGSLSLPANSLREQLTSILNGAVADGAPGGLNTRVSERGHSMRGALPIEKDYSQFTTTHGQDFIRALQRPLVEFGGVEDMDMDANYNENVMSLLQSFTIPGVLAAAEPVDHNGDCGPSDLWFSGFDNTKAGRFSAVVPAAATTGGGGNTGLVFLALVKIAGITGVTALNGWYFYLGNDLSGPSHIFTLRKLDGSTPNFSVGGAVFTTTTASFYFSVLSGSDQGARKYRAFFPTALCGGEGVGNGCGSVSVVAATTTGLREVVNLWTPGGAEGGSTKLHGILSPRRGVWAQTSAHNLVGENIVAATTVHRSTENILTGLDKAALDGNETSVMVDATVAGNHNHSSTYTRTIPHSNLLLATTGVLANPTPGIIRLTDLTPTTFVNSGLVAQLPAVPSGFVRKGIRCVIVAFLKTNVDAGSTGTWVYGCQLQVKLAVTGGATPGTVFLGQNRSTYGENGQFNSEILEWSYTTEWAAPGFAATDIQIDLVSTANLSTTLSNIAFYLAEDILASV